ncbi:type IV pilin protein [Xylella fastidiosa]|uniref:Prepilin-type N-terminal cleavage/methylation domain-containing protein n=3 Tax=Xylella fastidiosa TaxID=2371 RepID=A0A9Q4QS59_XYLFS|nr:type IV pilin protein [Xylella fastidiosa]MBE0268000.1 prepilin-type N-terminal cleavage/methylation domain-containing protein [Xylella fastidiosa subsp. multiplex]MBE0276117.1 prepilin-type N-terminal cleavage/methylation domain-containing protein [Xylella fastidiosa subsp. multiplex]MBE0276802.1 prepilin-type N-terminal cleavage/methylation domain-containing protein [Xylella fastidiosa subsp. multiplex]MBE0281385.1 prepilin-type N-terminal cleavage/methylation domain-containing protein [Xy
MFVNDVTSMIKNKKQNGFTLIEVMIVVVIVAILAAVAMTSYQGSILRTRRSAAQACLQQQAQFIERYYTTHMTYLGVENSAPTCDPSANLDNFYRFTVAAQASTFMLTADPQGAQAGDHCGRLTLSNTGERTPRVDGCW